MLSAVRGVAGLVIVSFFVLAAILAPVITSHDPVAQNLLDRRAPPSWQERGTLTYPLGADQLGRDVWSRLVHGARTSLVVAGGALAIGGLLGTAFGFFSGYWRGARDRIFDATLPRVVSQAAWLLCCGWIAIVLLASSGPGLINLIIVLGLVTSPRYIKPVRREVMLQLSQSSLEGTRDMRSAARILFTRVSGTLPAVFLSQIAFLIILEFLLTFLGLGVPPPTSSWGSMIADTRNDPTNWWIWGPPAFSILFTVGGFYMLGHYLRDRPRNSRAAS